MLRRFRLEEPQSVAEASELLGRFGDNAKVYAGGTELLLAMKEGLAIIQEALERFDISHARAVHRAGELDLSEPAVAVGVSAAHRDAAFRACRYIIDEIKHRLPIWKKEYYADGTAEWVNCRQCATSHAEHDSAA